MYCPDCKQDYDGRFCPTCGTPLIEKPAQAAVGLNLSGDANAINGGIHLSDSHNIHNEDHSQHSTVINNTTVAAQKTEMELLQERKNKFRNACKRAFEDNILEPDEKAQLDDLSMELDLDRATADRILDEVRQLVNRNAPKTELTGLAKIKLKQLTDALRKNEVQALMRQIDSFESLAGKFTNDELQYKYYLVLAALRHEKCIQKYESSKIDNYWKSFWSYVAYIKAGKDDIASDILFSMSDKFPSYPEDNITLLATAGSFIKNGKEAAKDYLDAVGGDFSPALQRFAESLYFLIDPETATEMGATEQGCAFYLINIFKQETGAKKLIAEQDKAAEPAQTKSVAAEKPKAAEQPQQAAAKPATAAPSPADILKKKWQAMTMEAFKMLMEIQDPDDGVSVVNMVIPPAMAGIPYAMVVAAIAFSALEQAEEAAKWADKVMALDPQNEDADVMLAKAAIYEQGLGRYEENIEYAIAFYRASAAKGNLDALCFVADMYYVGHAIGQDYQMALTWAKMAYEAKNPYGLFIFGRAYYEGKGLPKDTLTGKRLIREAAAMKDVFSIGSTSAEMYMKENLN